MPLKDERRTRESSSGIVRYLITFNVSVCNLFFMVRNAKVDRIFELNQQQDSFTPSTVIPRKPMLVGSRQHLDKNRSARPSLAQARSQLPPIDVIVGRYYSFTYFYSLYLLCKHLVLCLMRLDSFARLRSLDCLLLGRFVVNGRAIEVAPHFCCFLIIIKMIWLSRVRNGRTTYQLPVLEFLMTEIETVKLWSSRYNSSNSRRAGGQLYSSLFEYQNSSVAGGQQGLGVTRGLRPNRTLEAWSRLADICVKFNKRLAIMLTVLSVSFMRMCLPITLNKEAFELNYRFCIKWLADVRAAPQALPSNTTTGSLMDSITSYIFKQIQPNNPNSYPSEYHGRHLTSMPIEVIVMPFGEFVDFNLYHMLRMILDYVDSTLIYLEICFLFSSMLFFVFLFSLDLVIYCDHLSERLARLLSVMRANSNFKLSVNKQFLPNAGADTKGLNMVPDKCAARQSQLFTKTEPSFEPKPLCSREAAQWSPPLVFEGPVCGRRGAASWLERDIIDTQAMIADLFSLTNQYNKYNELQTLFLISFWFSYSALVSSWIFIPGNNSPKLEWYVVHAFATVYLFAFISKYSLVKRRFTRLYKLMVIAMALDGDAVAKKTAWISLVKFYSPIPLHCFRINRSIELDVLLGLKLVSWLFTALVVASSFFTVYSIK